MSYYAAVLVSWVVPTDTMFCNGLCLWIIQLWGIKFNETFITKLKSCSRTNFRCFYPGFVKERRLKACISVGVNWCCSLELNKDIAMKIVWKSCLRFIEVKCINSLWLLGLHLPVWFSDMRCVNMFYLEVSWSYFQKVLTLSMQPSHQKEAQLISGRVLEVGDISELWGRVYEKVNLVQELFQLRAESGSNSQWKEQWV